MCVEREADGDARRHLLCTTWRIAHTLVALLLYEAGRRFALPFGQPLKEILAFYVPNG